MSETIQEVVWKCVFTCIHVDRSRSRSRSRSRNNNGFHNGGNIIGTFSVIIFLRGFVTFDVVQFTGDRL